MKKIIFLLTLLASLTLNAQFSGYLGKKNLVELGMNVHMPLIYNNFYIRQGSERFYKRSGSNLKEHLDRFNPGFRVGYLRLLTSRFGLGLDFNYDAVNTAMRYYDFNKTDDIYVDEYSFEGENLQFRSITINPRIEYTSKGGLLPVGISHQFGFGIKIISLVDKNYLNQYYISDSWQNTYVSEEKDYSQHFTSMDPNRFIYKTINYTLHFRKPLSDHLLMNINFRYSLNLTNERVEDYYYSTYDFKAHVYSMLNKQQLSSVFMFNMGASYAF